MLKKEEVNLRVCVVFGTRPEAVKLWSVVKELRDRKVATLVVCTGQHDELLKDVTRVLDLRVDVDFCLMRAGQSPSDVAAGVLRRLPETLRQFNANWLIVQGDTTTTAAGALAGFLTGVKVAHVEAGLRTGDLRRPFPEEGNRRIVSAVATLHFAPTQHAAQNLLAEGVPKTRVLVTGNTVVDALETVRSRFLRDTALKKEILQRHPYLADGPYVLVTVHRRESFGEPMRRIFGALLDLAAEFRQLHFVYPVHPNPNVRQAAEMLRDHPRILLTEPMDYASFLYAMSEAQLIMSDSGGVQEEAPTFRVPVVVLRDVTERSEALESGWALLGTTDRERIKDAVRQIMQEQWRRPNTPNPFGDGKAAQRIVDAILRSAQDAV